jgi:hypothetical protein
VLDLIKNGYSKAEVINQLHAKNGVRNVKFRYDLLNKNEVKIGELSATSSGNRISFDSLAEIKRVGKFKFKENELSDVDWLNDRVQPIFMLKMQNGNYIEWSLGVFLLSSPTRRENYGNIWRDIEAYDSSLVLKEDKFTDRYRIVAGTKYVTAITTILNSAGIKKINITDSVGVIAVDKEFEIGESKLEVINQLLTELNYTSIWVDENSYFISKPYVLPSNKETEYEYKNDELSIIQNGAIQEIDLFNIPNKWIVTASNPEKLPLVSLYVNDSLTSKTSTVNRGRTIVDYSKVNDILDKTILDDYVKRLAYNSSQIYEKFIFSTAIMPNHSYSDMLYLEHSDFDISSKFTETNWDMDLVSGGTMLHSARRVIKI